MDKEFINTNVRCKNIRGFIAMEKMKQRKAIGSMEGRSRFLNTGSWKTF